MIMLLRIIRGLAGAIFLSSAIQVKSFLLTSIFAFDEIQNRHVNLAVLQFKVAVIFGVLFFGLRPLINRIYLKKHGTFHPSLSKGKFHL